MNNKTMKFTAGDTVRILVMEDILSIGNAYQVGDICVVKEVNPTEESDYTVFTKDGSDYWYFMEEELELVETTGSAEVPPESIEEILARHNIKDEHSESRGL